MRVVLILERYKKINRLGERELGLIEREGEIVGLNQVSGGGSRKRDIVKYDTCKGREVIT